MNIFRSFKKKNVINSTEANPIPKLLIVPKREFKKSGIKLKFILEVMFASFKTCAESILWLSKNTVI